MTKYLDLPTRKISLWESARARTEAAMVLIGIVLISPGIIAALTAGIIITVFACAVCAVALIVWLWVCHVLLGASEYYK